MQASLLRYVAAQALAVALMGTATTPVLADMHLQRAGLVPIDPQVGRLYAGHAGPSYVGADLYLLPYYVPVDEAPALLSIACRTQVPRAISHGDDDRRRTMPCI